MSVSLPKCAPTDERIAAFRRFNRFYTQKIGVLEAGYLQSPFSLTEARVLYELAQRPNSTATEIGTILDLDNGYLSRILGHLESRRFIRRTQAEQDGRQRLIQLTASGQKAAAALNERSQTQAGSLLARLTNSEQETVISAMTSIQSALGETATNHEPYIIRPHRIGDLGWIVYRHAMLYSQEYGWNQQFEALVAEIASQFLKKYDPGRERCWVADRAGETLGCVLLVRRSKKVAQLRLLLVEPSARGLGIGKRLVEECVRFAREAGYSKIVLWTHDVLRAARSIYQKAGFQLVATGSHADFGPQVTSETWELSFK